MRITLDLRELEVPVGGFCWPGMRSLDTRSGVFESEGPGTVRGPGPPADMTLECLDPSILGSSESRLLSAEGGCHSTGRAVRGDDGLKAPGGSMWNFPFRS